MKGKRRLLGVLMIIAALIIMQLPMKEADAATSASPFKIEGTTLVKYKGTEKNVSVPDTVEVIAKGAFEENDTVEVVVIPASVTRIEAYAFWGCDKLGKVILGSGLTEIGDFTFTNCVGLKDISIPKNIRSIGISAFADCVNMTEINIPPEVTSIHDTAFDGCVRLLINCEKGSYADEYAKEFYERQKEMPEYEDVPNYSEDNQNNQPTPTATPLPTNTPVPQPGDENSSLLGSTHVVANQAVVFIDNRNPTVYGQEATKEPEADPEDKEQQEEKEQTEDNNKQEGTENQDENQQNDHMTKPSQDYPDKYCIVDGRVIADQAYYQSKNLHKVKLPDGIVEIGQFSFARSSVENIELPESLETICYGAFYHCDNLTGMTLPDSIRNVEPKAFAYTAWLEEFLKGNIEPGTDFLISNGVVVSYRGNAKKVTIPEGVRVIAAEAFMNHTEITELKLPNSLLVIGEGAFEGCSGLSQIALGNQIEQIKDRAFADCALSKIRLPKSVQELGLKAFDDTVTVSYEGAVPAKSYEVSAQRLSNEKYRNYGKLSGEPGVQVQGLKKAYASLLGAKMKYVLSLERLTESKELEKAFQRNLHTQMPEDAVVCQMELTDDSKVLLTKLGKQTLTVTLPIEESFQNQELLVYTLDRNGQLERLESKKVRLDGVDSIQFETNYVSLFAVCPTGVLTDRVSILSLSGPNDNSQINEVATSSSPYAFVKWLAVALTLLTGVCFALKRSK